MKDKGLENLAQAGYFEMVFESLPISGQVRVFKERAINFQEDLHTLEKMAARITAAEEYMTPQEASAVHEATLILMQVFETILNQWRATNDQSR